jgi:hypothetical protein
VAFRAAPSLRHHSGTRTIDYAQQCSPLAGTKIKAAHVLFYSPGAKDKANISNTLLGGQLAIMTSFR